MLSLYAACLVTGLGVLFVQLFFGHYGGHDVHHGDGGHEITPWTVLASVRFWSFTLLAFGLVGTLLTFFSMAGGAVTLTTATLAGVASGIFSVTVISRLLQRSPQSLAWYGDVRGRVGRVVVPIAGDGRGKVRVDVKGSAVDVVARAREPLEAGEAVVVEEVSSDGEALVSRAPKELAP